jgi:hypothetical protein
MKAPKRERAARAKKFFTPAEANAMLPLLRSILRDVTELAHELQDRNERLGRVRGHQKSVMDEAHREELQQIEQEYEHGRERMQALLEELQQLGVELKDPYTGLLDFRCHLEGREVYLCWKLGEPEVAYWHDLDTGFAGRQKLLVDAPK